MWEYIDLFSFTAGVLGPSAGTVEYAQILLPLQRCTVGLVSYTSIARSRSEFFFVISRHRGGGGGGRGVRRRRRKRCYKREGLALRLGGGLFC